MYWFRWVLRSDTNSLLLSALHVCTVSLSSNIFVLKIVFLDFKAVVSSVNIFPDVSIVEATLGVGIDLMFCCLLVGQWATEHQANTSAEDDLHNWGRNIPNFFKKSDHGC